MEHDDEPIQPEADDHAEQSEGLQRIAAANEDAVWGDTERGKLRVPGIVSGDVGPKGKVAAQLRSLGRIERTTLGEVPFGTTTPGTGRLVLATMFGIVALVVAVIALVIWLTW